MKGKTVFFNPKEPIEFENEFFKGNMLFLVKTEPPDPQVTMEPTKYCSRKRRAGDNSPHPSRFPVRVLETFMSVSFL